MVETAMAIYKCRGCGKELTVGTIDTDKEKATIALMQESEYKFVSVSPSCCDSEWLTKGFAATLHRCDPEKLCVCDFIGWKVKEAENEHTV